MTGLGMLNAGLSAQHTTQQQVHIKNDIIRARIIKVTNNNYSSSHQPESAYMRKENQEIRKELSETKKMLIELMEKLGYKPSSSLKPSNDDKHNSSEDDSSYEGPSEEDSSDEA